MRQPDADPDSYVVAMELARGAAEEGLVRGEQPIGAVVLDADGTVLSCRHDEVVSSQDPLAHASVLAIRDAAQRLGSWRLVGASLVVTLEPCPLCAGAALSARLARVVIGARDPVSGSFGSRYNVGTDPRLNHELLVVDAPMSGEDL